MNMCIFIAFFVFFGPLFLHIPNRGKILSFMSMDYTTILRAVAILMIMLSHFQGLLETRIFTPFGGGGGIYLSFGKWIWVGNLSK